jgi:hypothetical protein
VEVASTCRLPSHNSVLGRSLHRQSTGSAESTSQWATLHYVEGVRILRERLLLRGEEEKVSDATISVILTLANCAYGMGEHEAAKRHLKGLCKISKLKQGLPISDTTILVKGI